MSISEKVLNKIKAEKVEPKPKWQFLLKDNFFKVSFVILMLVGGLSFSVLFYILFDRDWQFLSRGRFDLIDELLFALPVFWILALIVFVGVGYYNFRYTKGGYKHKGYLIVLASFLGSIFLGIFLFTFGAGQVFDRMLADNFPMFDYRSKYIERMWGHPEEGMVAGRIIEVRDGKIIILNDISNENWMVDCNKAITPPNFVLKPGLMIRVLGELESDYFIEAKEIIPFMKKCPLHSCPFGPGHEMKEKIIYMRTSR